MIIASLNFVILSIHRNLYLNSYMSDTDGRLQIFPGWVKASLCLDSFSSQKFVSNDENNH